MGGRTWENAILHLDIDAFYPAVEVLDNPKLQGKAVIVGGSRKRGVVSSASYEARKFGVHSAQPVATAMGLCPKGVFLPVRMARYKEVSGQVFKIFHLFTPLVEPVSIDEAFLNMTHSRLVYDSPRVVAEAIKKRIFDGLGLTCSVGVGPNKLIAKLAGSQGKPDGLMVISDAWMA